MEQNRRPLKVGLLLPIGEGMIGDRTPAWREINAMARQAEAAGFDSIWVNDHLLFDLADPVKPRYGGWESWSVLCSVAAITTRVEIGTFVTCTNFRHPRRERQTYCSNKGGPLFGDSSLSAGSAPIELDRVHQRETLKVRRDAGSNQQAVRVVSDEERGRIVIVGRESVVQLAASARVLVHGDRRGQTPRPEAGSTWFGRCRPGVRCSCRTVHRRNQTVESASPVP